MATRRLLGPFLVAVSLSLATACGGGTDAADGAGDSAGAAVAAGAGGSVTVVKDEAHWTMPTDPYDDGVISTLEAQARDTLRKPCMVKAGYTDFTVRYDASAPLAPDVAADGVTRVFNEDTASRYGYRMAPDPRDRLAAQVEAAGGSLWADQPQEFWDALGACDAEADEAMGVSGADDSADLQLAGQFRDLTPDTTSSTLAAAAAAWRECMAPLGIAGLPAKPMPAGSNPPDSLVEKWGWQASGQASAEEIQVASADAACRRSSGWFDAMYDAEWNLKQDFVSKHQAELDKLRESIEAKRARYQAIIAKGTA